MDNKFNKMLNDFLANIDAKDEKELNQKLQEFMEAYNGGAIEYENTSLDDAYELLQEAEMAKTKSQALKLAKKAYEICPECFDAIIFQAHIEENALKREKLLKEGLEAEKARLEKEKYFDKENTGHFYGIFETRPYIRGLYTMADYLLFDGKIKQARDICKEILRLNENDNMGARYLLMAIYAYLEEEKEMLNLYTKYSQENLEMLFPLFALYYKLGDDKKAKEYLKKIDKSNKNFVKYFKGTLKFSKTIPEGYYSYGDPSEIIMYFDRYEFLTDTLPTIGYYILENSKNSK